MALNQKVKEQLGQDVLKLILDSVTNGTVDSQKMSDVAFHLHETVGGSHQTRMGLPGNLPDQSEMNDPLVIFYGRITGLLTTCYTIRK